MPGVPGEKVAVQVNWSGLARAVLWTQVIAWSVSLAKAEATIWLTKRIANPVRLRLAVYGLAIALTLLFAPLSAWLAWRLQR